MEDEVVSETPITFSENAESAKKETSNVWKFFSKIGKDKDGVERAACNFCERDYAIGKNHKSKTNYGTSHLSRHISVCKGISNSNLNVNEMLSNPKSNMTQINQKIHHELLAKAIIQHDLPFNFVEYESIREWIKYLNPSVVMPSRNTVLSDIKKPPHTGSELEAILFDCLKYWGIDKKLFSITLDNASANDSMQDILKAHLRLQNSLLCDGEYFHIRCSAHILNLIVQEDLKVAGEALYKIRESVKYVKSAKKKFEKLYEEHVSDHFNTPSSSQSQPLTESNMLDKASDEGSRHKQSKVFKEFKKFQSETKSNIGKSELDLYLEEKSLDYDDNEDLDVLSYLEEKTKASDELKNEDFLYFVFFFLPER
ncbi:zinc finger BED domain-containing protein RICESLEEPER 1-like [Abrus precatorius]|uniref:Zinc finger BED domain-containing protein RICESLEEPER 1-like n=1 Tax=Abrus precatorius TaxID=3816 RepID=A0A8B8MBE5_ABRPR|nr:zinc finger BED domain-containing protein RICESLEEPER 1-like [Abrus precatorius]